MVETDGCCSNAAAVVEFVFFAVSTSSSSSDDDEEEESSGVGRQNTASSSIVSCSTVTLSVGGVWGTLACWPSWSDETTVESSSSCVGSLNSQNSCDSLSVVWVVTPVAGLVAVTLSVFPDTSRRLAGRGGALLVLVFLSSCTAGIFSTIAIVR